MRREDRQYKEAGNTVSIQDVPFFTFEPHVRQAGGRWGVKHENVFFNRAGVLEELQGQADSVVVARCALPGAGHHADTGLKGRLQAIGGGKAKVIRHAVHAAATPRPVAAQKAWGAANRICLSSRLKSTLDGPVDNSLFSGLALNRCTMTKSRTGSTIRN